jgi:hypothetical protein
LIIKTINWIGLDDGSIIKSINKFISLNWKAPSLHSRFLKIFLLRLSLPTSKFEDFFSIMARPHLSTLSPDLLIDCRASFYANLHVAICVYSSSNDPSDPSSIDYSLLYRCYHLFLRFHFILHVGMIMGKHQSCGSIRLSKLHICSP